jgi:CRISPR-associated protein Cst2
MEPHTTISPFSIRWQVRYKFQEQGQKVYEKCDNIQRIRVPQGKEHNPQEYIDDDVMGFMVTESAKKNQKGTTNARQGALGVNRAISLTPYDGTTFTYYNSREKDKLSIHSTNAHDTCYQYCFALDSQHLEDKSRIINVIDAFIYLGHVGGHYSDSLFDFSPQSVIFRWTKDNCPRFLYCFEQNENQQVVAPQLVKRVEAEDIDSRELWIGGEIEEHLSLTNPHIFKGVRKAAEELKRQISEDLKLPPEEAKHKSGK